MDKQKKILTITFCGIPNVGKSTLLNNLIKCKLAICSPKPQTTRNNIRGIITIDNTQLIFVDTPGIFKPKQSMLEKKIVKEAWQGFCGSDLICLIIDGQIGFNKTTQLILTKLIKNNIPIIVVINKSDLIDFDKKVLLAKQIWETNCVNEVFSLSAKTGKGSNELMNYFLSQAKNGNWLYEKDEITDKDNNFLASEFVREQLFNILQKELPYMLYCETEKYEIINGMANISILVIVGKENHKKIILGKNGSNIKKIIKNASKSIENLIQMPVKLKLFVKLNKKNLI